MLQKKAKMGMKKTRKLRYKYEKKTPLRSATILKNTSAFAEVFLIKSISQ